MVQISKTVTQQQQLEWLTVCIKWYGKKACLLTLDGCFWWGKNNTKILSLYRRRILDNISDVSPGF